MSDGLSHSQRQELEADLLQVQEQLIDQLSRIENESQPVQLDQQMVGRLSRMDAMQQQQMAQASQAHMNAHLIRVRMALKAFAAGDYGFCSDCDGEIGFDRLKARPDSPLCVGCQQRNESRE
jgi:DnaK suppressor protein